MDVARAREGPLDNNTGPSGTVANAGSTAASNIKKDNEKVGKMVNDSLEESKKNDISQMSMQQRKELLDQKARVEQMRLKRINDENKQKHQGLRRSDPPTLSPIPEGQEGLEVRLRI